MALARLREAQAARHIAATRLAAASDADNEAYLQNFHSAFDGGAGTELPAPSAPPHALAARAAPHCSRAPPAPAPAAAAPGWRTGPADARGTLVQLSQRPLLCGAACWQQSEVVLCGSDHALYTVDARSGRLKRTLYSKVAGHTEWVTAAAYLPGGAILSGGMDGQLWLWPPGSTAAGWRMQQPAAHAGPVARVACLSQHEPAAAAAAAAAEPAAGRISRCSRSSRAARMPAAAAAGPGLAASCSYDKSIKLWQVAGARSGCKLLTVLQGHAAPVLEMLAAPDSRHILTGDRNGAVMCWDVAAARCSWAVPAAHSGHVTALAWQQADRQQQQQQQQQQPWPGGVCALTGGQDGCLRVWDARAGSCAAQQRLHADAARAGTGALTSILTGCGSCGRLVVTAGADATLRVLDPSMSWRPLHVLRLTDYPYSAAAVPGSGDGGGAALVTVGCGDGSVHVVEVEGGSALYSLGAGRAAVRALEASRDTLVAAGDDGGCIVYSFA